MNGPSSYNFTRQEIAEFARTNQYAMMMFSHAGDDYVGARCLSLNVLLAAGCPLFAQAVEKFLKAFIFLSTGKRTAWKKGDLHNPFALKEELKQSHDYGLDKFDALLLRLYGHFQRRYFDNPDQSPSLSTSELDGFDELWMHLFDKVPMPEWVKYRAQFAVMVLDNDIPKSRPEYRHWAVVRNKALTARLTGMQSTYDAVLKHYIAAKH